MQTDASSRVAVTLAYIRATIRLISFRGAGMKSCWDKMLSGDCRQNTINYNRPFEGLIRSPLAPLETPVRKGLRVNRPTVMCVFMSTLRYA